MKLSKLLLSLCLVVVSIHQAHAASGNKTLSNADQVENCSFAKANNWWQATYASLPSAVANNPTTGDPEFCEFYQFSQDWFLYLISPSPTKNLANWQDPKQFPLLETSGTDSCDNDVPKNAFNVRTVKSTDAKEDFVIPERIDQAGRNVYAIYDQQGNIVFYEVRFSINLCDYKKMQMKNNFPGKTAELKMAWRVLTKNDSKDDFYHMEATISGKPYLLGLVGWHIVVAADNHPEMVWMTLDHNSNAVECTKIAAGQNAYDFTSAACAKNAADCNNLNKTLNSTAITLPSTVQPNDICQQFKYGTLEGQPITTKDGLNIALVKKLNGELQNLFTQPKLPKSLAVWKHYQVTGALWISDINKDSSDTTNQRGSLELANTVMETEFQGTAGQANSATNCFACHNYSATQSNTSTSAGLSHIFDDIIAGQQCRDVQSSVTINSQPQAQTQCPTTCKTAGALKWNGQWTNQDAKTGKQLPMTVCGCCPN
ncbi:mannan-binding lectin [Saccharophagus degradans]|uniref:Mannan-binding protein domain-containing protein n=1 Tax=Saccharophagus degradans (strain 2-40 / ATCC 43961 / DSM 17024) TaxID=203122 RepID=Q21NZ3_SACD2|nr:mannan-binding lectin [Saccharophagus degradans]ABD79586.1 hypothetical protein Sde_0322 [Saccharophagus degradans 2-40]